METLTATTQYGDFRGEAMADNSDHEDIQVLAKAHGIQGYPVGISLYSEGKPIIAIYTTDVGGSYDAIEAAAKANGGTLKVQRHVLEGATVADFLKIFKRFDVALRYRYKSVAAMEYET